MRTRNRHSRYSVPAALIIIVVAAVIWIEGKNRGNDARQISSVAEAPRDRVSSRPGPSRGDPPVAEASPSVPAAPHAGEDTAQSGEPVGPLPVIRRERAATASPGSWGIASVFLDGKPLATGLSPDSYRTYPCVQLPPEAEVEVVLRYPPGEAGRELVVQAQDGGHCSGSGTKIDLTQISDRGEAHVKLRMDDNPGIYRFSLHRGGLVEDLDFWVGELPAPAP